MDKIKVFALIDQHEDGDLWYDYNDPESPQKIIDFIKDNIDEGVELKIKIDTVDKEDFDRED